jgi:tRNA G18 (ribose-2'-O)-methylase SpoU
MAPNAFVALAKLSLSPQFRNQARRCIISSPKLLNDLNKEFSFEQLYYSGKQKPSLLSENEPILVEDSEFLARIAQFSRKVPDIALGVLNQPTQTALQPGKSTFLIAFQHISDELLIGGLLRTAAALGFSHAVFLNSVPDGIFSPQGIRSQQGALWRIPHCELSESRFQDFIKNENIQILKHSSNPQEIPPRKPKLKPNGYALLVNGKDPSLLETDLSVRMYNLAKKMFKNK